MAAIAENPRESAKELLLHQFNFFGKKIRTIKNNFGNMTIIHFIYTAMN